MSEFKGTKGKWVIGVVPKYNDTIKSAMLEIQNDGVWVCKVQNNGVIKSKEGKANALLISKAPELLQILQRIENILTYDTIEPNSPLQEEIYKLIKQATEL